MKDLKEKNMSLKYLSEHLCCDNYIAEHHVSFQSPILKKGEKTEITLKKSFSVIFLSKGTLTISVESDETKELSEQNICLLNGAKVFTLMPKEKCELTILNFDYPQIKCDKYSLLGLKEYIKTGNDDSIRILPMVVAFQPFLQTLSVYVKTKMFCKHLAALKESEYFFLMRAFYTKEQSAYFLEPVIKSLNNFDAKVRQNYLNVKSVKELAVICNMTEKTFTRKFKEHFNCTPKQWMLTEKAKHINSDLKNESLNLKEISDKYGFSSTSHFNNYYKKQFNKTPGGK